MKKLMTLWMILFFIGSAANLRAESMSLNINCTLHSPYEKFFFRVVKEICSRNGITVVRNTPPVGRSLINVNQGLDDGDGPRIKGLSSGFPNLICVPEPFGYFNFGAFTRDPDIRVEKWSDLADLDVAYIHGWKIFDNNVKHARSITKVKNAELLFRLLDASRADAVLITRFAGEDMARKLGLEKVFFSDPPLARTPNFLYLNRRHEALAPVLGQTLREMKKSGDYQSIYKEMLGSKVD